MYLGSTRSRRQVETHQPSATPVPASHTTHPSNRRAGHHHLSRRLLDDWLRPSLRSQAPANHRDGSRGLFGARPPIGYCRHAALLPGAGHRARGPARDHCRLHLQPWCRSAADVDAASENQPARLAFCGPRAAALGVRRRQGTAGARNSTRCGDRVVSQLIVAYAIQPMPQDPVSCSHSWPHTLQR